MGEVLAAGQLFGDFEIQGLAGEGGMGRVYRATQVSLGRLVALKVISPEIGSNQDFRERFARESRAAAAVDHPHVVTLYEAGELEGELYIALQWINGPDLNALLREGGPLSPERAVTLGRQVAGALHAVHVAGLMHRDVKPANILVRPTDDGEHAYLADFGIAKVSHGDMTGLTKTGMWVGTQGYMAPELVRGEAGDGRSDLYALGCVLFECLTGEAVFKADNEAAVLWAHASGERPVASERRPELGDRYDAALARALAIDPAERFQTGAELAIALASAATDSTSPTPAVPLEPTVAHVPQTEPAAHAQQHEAETAALPPSAATPAWEPDTTPYAGEPPSAAAAGRPSRIVALTVLAVLAAAGIAVGAIAATGGFSGEDTNDSSADSSAAASDSGSTTDTDSGDDSQEEKTILSASADAVVSVLESYQQAYTARDTAALGALFTSDIVRRGLGTLTSTGCGTTTGRANVLEVYENQFAAGTGTYDLPGLSADDVELNGTTATVPANYTISPNSSGSIDFTLVEDSSGWLISRVFASC